MVNFTMTKSKQITTFPQTKIWDLIVVQKTLTLAIIRIIDNRISQKSQVSTFEMVKHVIISLQKLARTIPMQSHLMSDLECGISIRIYIPISKFTKRSNYSRETFTKIQMVVEQAPMMDMLHHLLAGLRWPRGAQRSSLAMQPWFKTLRGVMTSMMESICH